MDAEGYVRVNLLSFIAHILNFEFGIREDWCGQELSPNAD